MSRAVRTARGSVGATIATTFAATSHGLAGGGITALAVIATAVLALPLCVALAGRIASLWRLGLAVTASQLLYHWSFSGLGEASALGASQAALGPHAKHLSSGMLSGLTAAPSPADAGLVMWLAHALAAVGTVALVHRGERAFLALSRVLLSSILRLPAPVALDLPTEASSGEVRRSPAITIARLCCAAAITHRGPPTLSA